MNKRNLILGIDPGPAMSGWAFYDYITEKVLDSGHADWSTLRSIVKGHNDVLKAVCIEQIIIHFGIPANQNLPKTAESIGRIQQICEDNCILFHQLPRIDIMEKIYKRPKRGMKISKKDMQDVVQKLLGLDKPIRPQHANDALCAILAFYSPKGI